MQQQQHERDEVQPQQQQQQHSTDTNPAYVLCFQHFYRRTYPLAPTKQPKRQSQSINSSIMSEENAVAVATKGGDDSKTNVEDMSLLSITDGENGRGIPLVKFIEDVDAFSKTFNPAAEAELLIGAYSELHSKFKTFEATLTQKSKFVDVRTMLLK